MKRLSRQGFTLIELLVVIGMIALLAGAVGSGVMQAQMRAKIARASAECREITNAILAYENYDRNHSLQNHVMQDADAGRSTLAFILGESGSTEGGEKIPVLYNAAMVANKIVDPWGRPYKVTIQPASGMEGSEQVDTTAKDMTTTLYLPNHTRLSAWERGQ